MNVQIIHFVDIWLKRLCLKICNTARCNKRISFTRFFHSEEEEILTLSHGAKSP